MACNNDSTRNWRGGQLCKNAVQRGVDSGVLAGFYRVYGEIGVGAIFENDVIIYFDLNEKRPMRLPRAAAKHC